MAPELPLLLKVGYLISILLRILGIWSIFAAYDSAIHSSLDRLNFIQILRAMAGSREAITFSFCAIGASISFILTSIQFDIIIWTSCNEWVIDKDDLIQSLVSTHQSIKKNQ